MDEQPQSPRSSLPPVWVWVIVILGIVIIANFYFRNFSGGEEIPINEVAELVRSGEDIRLTVTGDRIDVEFLNAPNEPALTSTKEAGSDFYEVMTALGVEDFEQVDVRFVSNAGWNMLWTVAISVLPILLFKPFLQHPLNIAV